MNILNKTLLKTFRVASLQINTALSAIYSPITARKMRSH